MIGRKTGISLKEFGLAVGGLDYSSVRHCGQPDLKPPHPFASREKEMAIKPI
jgi:hypothetical protein